MTVQERDEDDSGRSRAERQEISRQLSKAWKGITAMRTFFWTGMVACALLALVVSGWWQVGAGVAAALFLAGALGVRQRPFLWSIVTAIGLTPLFGFAAVMCFLSDPPLILRGLIAGALILGAWSSVGKMRRAEQLLAEHGDTFAARRITGAKREKRG